MGRIKYSPEDSQTWEIVSFTAGGLEALVIEKFEKANEETNLNQLAIFDAVVFHKNDLLSVFAQDVTCEILAFSHIVIKDFNASTLLVCGENESGDKFESENAVAFIGKPFQPNLTSVKKYTPKLAFDVTLGSLNWTIAPGTGIPLTQWLSTVKNPKFQIQVLGFEKARISKSEFNRTFKLNSEKKWIAFFPGVFHCKVPVGQDRYPSGDYCTLLAAELSSTGAPLSTTDFKMLVLTDTWRPNWPRTTGFTGFFNYLSEKTNELFSGLSKLFK